jgi:putative oxidoreductase
MLSTFFKNVINPLVLRLALAAVFIFHGLDLVQHDGGANWMPGENPQPAAVQLAVAWGELLGGVALALGFLTRLAALGLAAIMAGAIATVHLPHGFNIKDGGFEYNVVILAICLCLVLGGPGPLAVDRLFRLRRAKQG